ncbi:pentapeptide repeat-containing protein [Vibrio sp. WXL210]|uniref:pentapeptide repeat-containing protein n=1 Tax=Vibrio sp. WXL210 TaxID=3450709 RepID=UPI003EC4B94F
MISDNQDYFEQQFAGQELSEQTFRNIEFEDCQFTDCDFSTSEFTNCKFLNCDFSRCNLSLVKLTNSSLFGLNFYDCKLIGVDWTRAAWATYHVDFELAFTRCILNDSSFFGLTLQELKLEECKLHDVDFREGDFAQSLMTYCDFSHSQFMRTNLGSVDFSDSYSFTINVLENNVREAKFTRYEALSLLEGLGIELVD